MEGSILDAEGSWTAEEGRYNKAELCKEYDLDVGAQVDNADV
jgi:hypothetical protein